MRGLCVSVIAVATLLALVASLPAASAQVAVPSATPQHVNGTITPEAGAVAPLAPVPGPPPPREIPGLDGKLLLAADQQVNEVLLQIERIQTARAAVGVPLLQLAATHRTPPQSLAGAAPDLRARVGIDSWWSADVDLPAAMVTSVRVDVYDGPHGSGYVIIARAGAFERRVNVGPELWREQDWRPR